VSVHADPELRKGEQRGKDRRRDLFSWFRLALSGVKAVSVLNEKHFYNEAAAYAFVESHIWGDGRVCPHCGTIDRSGKLKGKSTRIGIYKCYACRKPFTVKVGTIFESSHIKMHIWLQAIFLISSGKKGISSNQLSRVLGITLKSAWFLSHRIRDAMKNGSPIKDVFRAAPVLTNAEVHGIARRAIANLRNQFGANDALTILDFILTELANEGAPAPVRVPDGFAV
jgi:transposase-like protein